MILTFVRNMMYILYNPFIGIGIKLLPGPAAERLPHTQSLTASDFKNTVYITEQYCWESWPDRLYTPEELPAAEPSVLHDSLDYTRVQYATHRTRFTLIPGEVFALYFYSPDYSMRLFIDGRVF